MTCTKKEIHGPHAFQNPDTGRMTKCQGNIRCRGTHRHPPHRFYPGEDASESRPLWCIGRFLDEEDQTTEPMFCGDIATHGPHNIGEQHRCIGTTNHLVEMFEIQRKLQQRYGHDFSQMIIEERVWYAKDIILALLDEMHEALGEIGWKQWATSRHFNRDAFVGELIDAWHFLMNLFLVADCSPEEMYQRYMAKNVKNHTRQNNGYDGVTDKCPKCRRAYDDDAVKCFPPNETRVGYCAVSQELSD